MNNFGKGRIFCDLEDCDRTYQVANALASPVRLGILRLLVHKSMSISELAHALNVSISSISMHVSILKDAGMISVASKPGKHGTFKVCGAFVEAVQFDFFTQSKVQKTNTVSWEIPIGSYSDVDVVPPCGIVGQDGYFEQEDEPYVFFHPMHDKAQLLWFTSGELTYRISNRLFHTNDVTKLVLSFEICSEAPDANGTLADGVPVSSHTIESLDLAKGYYFSLSFGVESGGHNAGGMNLFGKDFGNYDQAIKVEIEYLLG